MRRPSSPDVSLGRLLKILVMVIVICLAVLGPDRSCSAADPGLTSFSSVARLAGIEPLDPGFRLASPEIVMKVDVDQRLLETTFSADLQLIAEKLPNIENWVFWVAEWVTEVTIGGVPVPVVQGTELQGNQGFHFLSLPMGQAIPKMTRGSSERLVIRTRMESQGSTEDEEDARRYGTVLDLQGRVNELSPLCVPGSVWDVRIVVPRGWSGITRGERAGEVPSESEDAVTFRWRVPVERRGGNFMIALGPYSRTPLDLPGDFGLWLLEEDFHRKDRIVDAVETTIRKANEAISGQLGLPALKHLEIVKANSPGRNISGKGPWGLMLIEYGRETTYSLDNFVWTVSHELCHQWFPGRAQVDFGAVWLSEGMATFADARYVSERWPLDDYFLDQETFLPATQSISLVSADLAHVAGSVKRQVIYLKGAWVVNMLRQIVGDDAFRRIVQRFYQPDATGADVLGTPEFQVIAEEESGLDLGPFFRQWLDTATNPDIVLDQVTVGRVSGGWLVRGIVRNRAPMPLPPVTVGVMKNGVLVNGVSVVLPGTPGSLDQAFSTKPSLYSLEFGGDQSPQEAPFEIVASSLFARIVLDPGCEILNVAKSGKAFSLFRIWAMRPEVMLLALMVLAVLLGTAVLSIQGLLKPRKASSQVARAHDSALEE